MQRTSFADMQCPIARSLERVGEWWSILILRDAFRGVRRFDAFQASLGIAPNMLTRRLKPCVAMVPDSMSTATAREMLMRWRSLLQRSSQLRSS